MIVSPDMTKRSKLYLAVVEFIKWYNENNNKMRKKDLPEIIFFEEKVGSNGIHCLDYKNSSNIKYIREDVVNKISSKPMLVDSYPLHHCAKN